MSRLETSGFEELAKKFRKLEMKTQSKLVGQVAGFSMTPVVSTAKRNAPVGKVAHKTYEGKLVAPGYAKRSIKKRNFKHRDGGGVSVIVGPAKDAFYLTQFVEIGTVKQRRQDWLLKSYRQTKDQVERRFADRMGQKIEQLAGNSSQ